MDEPEPGCPPSAEDAWVTLRALHECVARSLARGDRYDLLVSAARDAKALLARQAATQATAREQPGTSSVRKAA
jgi:hypothetical protein